MRAMQRASLAGRHEAAERCFEEARRLDPNLPHLAVQAALAAARRGAVDRALRLLDDVPESSRDDVHLLFRGWLTARAGRVQPSLALLEPLVRRCPDNRVAATAYAYALCRAGQIDDALAILRAGPGDNLEVLAFAWLELERAAGAWPIVDTAPPTIALAGPVRRATARRWFHAALAAGYEPHVQVIVRRWLIGLARRAQPPPWVRPLRPLLEWAERCWPTDELRALLAVRATGHDFPRLGYHLGAALCDRGHYRAALAELEPACVAMADSPERYLPYVYRAAALAELGRWEEVESALAAAVEGEGEEAEVHEFAAPYWLALRARARLARGDDTGALADLNAALAADPAVFDERLAGIVARRHGREQE